MTDLPSNTCTTVIPNFTDDTLDALAAARGRIAMHGLDTWVAAAERFLVDRQVVITRSPHEGKIVKVIGVTVATGASGYHMFLQTDPQGWVLLELGVSCELLAKDDTPDA